MPPLNLDLASAIRDASASAESVKANTLEADVNMVGVRVAINRRFKNNWSTTLWADATWDGKKSAGASLRKTW